MTIFPNPIPTGFPEFRKDLTLPCSFGSETTRNDTKRYRSTVPCGFARILPCLVVLEAKPRETVRNARAGHDGQYWDVNTVTFRDL